ncbi:MAG: NarK/NasA family nitrate transporter [Chloroflexota bacterium]|nr:MAG: NarK/NasA family nitrate transporter [Chloroflexota bacterium]
MIENRQSIIALTMSALSFTVCFAVWTMNGVLVTFLSDNRILTLDPAQIGWLIGIPVLTGAITRLPVGMLTDRYGGKYVFAGVMLLAAIPAYLMSYANTYTEFILGSLGFGLAGASFAVGIAYTSVWFKKDHQGTALGIFGAGNVGASLTSLGAPSLLQHLTNNGANLDGWRTLPQIYAFALVGMAVLFLIFTKNRKAERNPNIGMLGSLKPLKSGRVWRFGLYYFLVFGGFVALSQWLIPYYVSVYAMSLVTAGFLATLFSMPSGLIRAIGGWMSDRFGARAVMYWILAITLLASLLLIVPPVNVQTPGQSVMATEKGVVTAVTESEIVVTGKSYPLKPKTAAEIAQDGSGLVILPQLTFWQEPTVQVGDQIKRKQLLAQGITYVYFPATVWVFTFLVFLLGVTTGIGKAAVYKHIAEYFPNDMGVVGGLVGVIGALGGFFLPILWGYLVGQTGLWTTTWLFFAALTMVSLVWMHLVVRGISKHQATIQARHVEAVAAAERVLVGASASAER